LIITIFWNSNYYVFLINLKIKYKKDKFMNQRKKITKRISYRKLLFLSVILIVLGLILFPYLKKEQYVDSINQQYVLVNGSVYLPEHSPLRNKIGIDYASSEAVRRQVIAPASVEAKPSMFANIYPPAGGRIVRLFVNVGQTVKAGQALFEIYSPDLAEIQTEYISAKSASAQAERQLNRVKDLHERGIASLREVEEAQTEFEIAKSELKGASLKLSIMGIEKDDIGKATVICSPINGRVIDLAVAPGEFIAEPEEPLMIIADLSKVWVRANIQEKDIRFVEADADAKASFAAYPGEVYEGKVLFVSDILDEETRTTRVIIEFENENLKLKPGMFATVKLLSEPSPHILIDPKAVLQRRDYSYVYVQKEPFTFEKRIVITGDLVDEKIIIFEGLVEGERIVNQNAVTLP